MAITTDDMRRLLTEMNSVSIDKMHTDWMKNNGFEEEVQQLLVEWGGIGIAELMMKIAEEEPEMPFSQMIVFAAATIASGMFTIGWEAHKEYGGRKTVVH